MKSRSYQGHFRLAFKQKSLRVYQNEEFSSMFSRIKLIKIIFNRRPAGPSKAMKLGSKAKDVDSFVDQLKSEGESKCLNLTATVQFWPLKIFWKQECIPVGCVPPAAIAVFPNTHQTTPHPPTPYTPPSPTTCMPPAMHAPPPLHIPSCHTCPPPPPPTTMHAPSPATRAPLWTKFLTQCCDNISLPQLRCRQ